jgi:4-hydroxythreonine-4-phosphate dehydrogenase
MAVDARPIIALTTGEPAGIGPELCVQLDPGAFDARLVLIGDAALLDARSRAVGARVRLVPFAADMPPPIHALEVLHHPLAAPSQPGQLDPRNARYVLDLLDAAIDGCIAGRFAAMVTAPLHKGVMIEGGYPGFTGHTEYLAERTGTPRVVMMLAGPLPAAMQTAGSAMLRVALATTHLPLRAVADALTPERLTQTLRILDQDLRQKFGLTAPRILVAGLNPHAGEGGHLGTEEQTVIEPVLSALRAEGMQLIGPLPADTLFNPSQLAHGDAVLAMYHDQGLPVLKFATFGHGVNVTLGLPIVRTSVDHGTALDLAGTGRADPGSLIAAVHLAAQLARTRCA